MPRFIEVRIPFYLCCIFGERLACCNGDVMLLHAEAMISPIDALFIAVIVVAALVTLEKFIEFPFILILDAAEEASPIFTVRVTKLLPFAVTFVDEEITFIASAFAAAEALVEAPTAISFILISCEAVNALVLTKSELICVLLSISLNPNLCKSSIFP